MFCTNCGSEILPGQGFCTNCGEPAPGASAQAGTTYSTAQQTSANAYGSSYDTGSYNNGGYANTGYDTGAYNNGGYSTGTYNNGGYNTGYNTGYYNTGVVAQPEKKGFPWLAVAIASGLVILVGGACVYGSKQMGGNGTPSDPVVVASSEATSEEVEEKEDEIELAKNSTEDSSIEDASVAEASEEEKKSSGNYSTMKKTDSTVESEYPEIDAKGYAETNFNDYYSEEYEYVTAYYNPTGYVFVPNGGLNDDTVIRDKKMSDFCDYIDKAMSGSDMKLNRELFYKVLAADLVDSSLSVDDDAYFEQSMVYSLSFAVHFNDMQVEFNHCKTYKDAPTRYYYSLSAFGVDDVWMVDYSNRQIIMNRGTTEYESHGSFAALSDESLALWVLMVDAYYDLEF